MFKPVFASVLMVATMPGTAQAQLSAVAIGALVDQLEGSVRNTIDRADDAVNNNSFRLRQHGEILLGQLDAIATGQREKTFAQLTAVEQKTFMDIKATIDQLASLQKVTAADVQAATNRVGIAMANLPFGKVTPRVTDYLPAYIVSPPTTAAATQVVTVSGMLLGEGKPKLRMQGADCTLLSNTEINLKFSCPTATWKTTSGVGTATGDLQVYKKAGFFSRLFGGKPEPRPYKVTVFVVPPELGKYALNVTRKTSVEETQPRYESYRQDNGHCQGARDALFQFNVTPGWSIVLDSVVDNCDRSERSSCQGVVNKTASSFGVSGVVRNNGRCGPFGAYVDARGNVRGHVTWTEKRLVEGIVAEPVGQGTLAWGQAVQLPLPSNTQSISLTIDQMDGERAIVTGNDMAHAWYTVQSDPANNFVLISPRPVSTAMEAGGSTR